MELEKLRYPIGRLVFPEDITKEIILENIKEFESFPTRLKTEVEHLNNDQLDTPYRPKGWTIRQVVNHCADSHMNSLIRFKWTLTEDRPTIKAYEEAKWAELADSITFPVAAAIKSLEGIHIRWVALVKSLSETDLDRCYLHPQNGKSFSLNQTVCLYSWHCQHHLAHITNLKKAKGWS